MPTSVSTGAYIAALHKKLAQAERSLHEFRVIFNHMLDEQVQEDERSREGLYPGQLDNLVDSADTDGDVGECIE